MEFHSDMGDGQRRAERNLVRRIEKEYLAQCNLITTSSPQVAEALSATYGVHRLLPLYNAPPAHKKLPPKTDGPVSLYWRNAVIGLSQRGLEDALLALRELPGEIVLHLQGRLPNDGGRALTSRIERLELTERVRIHGPFLPHEAVCAASPYTVGLCLERPGVTNHELTVSNKIFDYFMAGLAVVASDLPGLREVVMRSGAGLLFEAGQPHDLAGCILQLHDDRELLRQQASNARVFALHEGNAEHEMLKLRTAFASLVERPSPVTAQ
jgi:glycosyltransferase involved in cell wall biosynthesis